MTDVVHEETRDLTIGQALDFGCQLAMYGNHQGAIGMFRGVLIHEPVNFEAIERLGASLFELKQFHEALYWFWRGIKLSRHEPMALSNYGLVLCQLGHHEEGLPFLHRAIHHAEKRKDFSDEGKAICYNNLGNTLERMERHAEALPALEKGIRLNPHDPFPRYNRGIVLLRLNRHREAIDALSQVVAKNPNDADATYNRGMGRLLLGDLEGGFKDYEARLVTSENKVPNLGLPANLKWNGTDSLEGKTVLVHCEQGLGDTIQFLRFIPELAKLNPASIMLIAHGALKPMIEGLAPLNAIPNLTVLTSGRPLEGNFDCWVALMSLPMCLGTTEETIPAPWCPEIEPERTMQWHKALKLPADKVKVGICWAGNFQHKNDKHRSIPLDQFARLFDVPGVHFVSLQQLRPGEVEPFEALQAKYPNLTGLTLNDFRDTAAVMQNVDFVISVDTAVAHLAATLDIPTQILVPAYSTDWRWQLERGDSPWYPAAEIHRQHKVGDWATVIRSIKAGLVDLARQAQAA